MDTIQPSAFSAYTRGILYDMLLDAYSADAGLVAHDNGSWADFDTFVFDNLDIMDRCGFISVIGNTPAGFISWDPRNSPDYVQIGHNCIIGAYKGRGYGKAQLAHALQRIRLLQPHEILVSTGATPMFLPARSMYESVGFQPRRVIEHDHPCVPQVVEYYMDYSCLIENQI